MLHIASNMYTFKNETKAEVSTCFFPAMRRRSFILCGFFSLFNYKKKKVQANFQRHRKNIAIFKNPKMISAGLEWKHSLIYIRTCGLSKATGFFFVAC